MGPPNRSLVFSILAVVVVGGLIPSALAQTATSYSFNKSSPYFQGDSGSISVTLKNEQSFQICTKEVYLQFDWQQAQNTIFADTSDTPCIATGNFFKFTMNFTIPSDESVGVHLFKVVWVDKGFILGSVTVLSLSLSIHDAQELVYTNTLGSVSSQIAQYQSMNFKSPPAVAQLNQALNLYNQAATLANQGQWSQAVTALNQALTAANQAYAAEQTYEAAQTSESSSISSASSQSSGQAASTAQTNLTYEVLAIIAVTAIVGVLVLYRRRSGSRSKQTAPTP